MKLVFKLGDDVSDLEYPTIGESNFKEHNPTVNVSMHWSTIQPLIRQATEEYVLDYVGEELYNHLADKFQDNGTLTDKEKRALQLMQDTISWYSGMVAMQTLNVTPGDMGVMQNSSKEGVAHPTSQWAFKDALKSSLSNGDKKLERLLNYLETNVADFEKWKTSSAYNIDTANFLRRTKDADQYLNLKKSRRSFVALSKWFRIAEEKYLCPILDKITFKTYSDKFKAGEQLNDIEKQFIRLCQKVVAWKGLAEGHPHLAISVEEDGFRVVSRTDGFQDKRNTTNAQHLKLQQALLASAKQYGDEAEACLISFLYQNQDTFTDWAGSDSAKTLHSKKSIKVIHSPNGRGGIML